MEEFEFRLPEKPSEKAMHIASRCWCDPETEMVEMDVRLAMAFAKRVHELLNMTRLYPRQESGGEVGEMKTTQWTRPQGQYRRPKEEQEIFRQVTGGDFMNPWDCEPEVERRLRLKYSDEELNKIYANIWKDHK